jgi:VanZ family protein
MKWILRYKYSVLVALAIIILSTIPIPEVKPLEEVPLIDKWVHFVMYASLSIAMWIDQKNAHQPLSSLFYLWMIVLPSCLGGILELVQAYLTTCRSGEWLDAIADAIGAVIGTAGCYIIGLIWNRKTSVQK